MARLRCIACGKEHIELRRDCRCPACGGLIEAIAPPILTATAAQWRARRTSAAAADESGVWRFREALPEVCPAEHVVTLREGHTPLYELPQCARWAGLDRLWAKHQGMNPTGSFKDTGMTVAVSHARALGAEWLACASTGNTSASLAAYAARAGLRSLILVPEGKIAPSKLAQALDFGALACSLRTDFDGCVRVLNEVAAATSVMLMNSVNPYRVEGQKTAILEVLEALDWTPPDHIVVPGGNLANVSAIGKGLMEAQQWGLIPRLPRVSVVQAAGANPLARSWRANRGRTLTPVAAETRASAIRIGNPASWQKAVRVLEATGGTATDVTEVEIAEAKRAIGREGIGCEPASAAALAGTRKLVRQGCIAADSRAVLILTGHALKDPEFVLETIPGQGGMEADAASVQRAMAAAR